MNQIMRKNYGSRTVPLTKGEAILCENLKCILEQSSYELEAMLLNSALYSPRRDYWRLAAAIHVCKMRNSRGRMFCLPPEALSHPSYRHSLRNAWRLVGHYYEVAIKTGLLVSHGPYF